MRAIEYDIHGIKCDSCDFNDESVKMEDYDQWLNKPCPKCGANLLTEADYNFVKRMVAFAETMNGIFPPRRQGEKLARTNFELDGSGQPKINIKEEVN